MVIQILISLNQSIETLAHLHLDWVFNIGGVSIIGKTPSDLSTETIVLIQLFDQYQATVWANVSPLKVRHDGSLVEPTKV